ncbi:MAG: hypothetical protein NXH73_04210 [Flavobacteriaceae bacterium]|nr:hypothetical protein [Flavobacteriaceae bacterium]
MISTLTNKKNSILEFSAWNLEFGAWNLKFDASNFGADFGIWNLEFALPSESALSGEGWVLGIWCFNLKLNNNKIFIT